MSDNTSKGQTYTQALLSDIQSIRQSYTTPGVDTIGDVYDMSERIATALYMVSAHLPVNDTLRISLRQSAVTMVELSGGRDTQIDDRHDTIAHQLQVIDRIVSFMRIARISRVISEINSLMIERECARLHKIVSAEYVRIAQNNGYHPVRDGYDMQSRIANILQPASDTTARTSRVGRPPADARTTPSSPKPEQAEQTEQQYTPVQSNDVVLQSYEKQNDTSVVDMIASAIRNTTVNITDAKINDTTSSQRSEQYDMPPVTIQSEQYTTTASSNPGLARKISILDFIRRSGIVTVKDITTAVTGYSDKSIQRTLQDLIEEGAIIRHGDKRWAKYEAVA